VDITPQSRWLDTGDTRVSDRDWRRVFVVDAVDGETVRGTGLWEVRDRVEGDDRDDTDAAWHTFENGMETPAQFATAEFGMRLQRLDA